MKKFFLVLLVVLIIIISIILIKSFITSNKNSYNIELSELSKIEIVGDGINLTYKTPTNEKEIKEFIEIYEKSKFVNGSSETTGGIGGINLYFKNKDLIKIIITDEEAHYIQLNNDKPKGIVNRDLLKYFK